MSDSKARTWEDPGLHRGVCRSRDRWQSARQLLTRWPQHAHPACPEKARSFINLLIGLIDCPIDEYHHPSCLLSVLTQTQYSTHNTNRWQMREVRVTACGSLFSAPMPQGGANADL